VSQLFYRTEKARAGDAADYRRGVVNPKIHRISKLRGMS